MNYHPYIFLLFLLATASLSASWTNWRGPDHNLSTGHEDFPAEFSPSENVAWSVKLPGEGASTPAIWDGHLYVTSLRDGFDTLIAFDLQGKHLWEKRIGEGEEGSHRQGTGANPSPVVDPTGVYVYFKSASLAKFSHGGKELWKKNLQEEYSLTSQWWDLGTSPVVDDKKVYIAVMQQLARRRTGEKCETYVVAFDKMTGEEIWKVDRFLDAPVESNDAYTTPLIAEVDGQKQLIMFGADQLTAHSLDTGKTLWRCRNFNPQENKNWRTIASPVIKDGIAVVPYGRGYAVAGIKMGGRGDITEGSRIWEIQRVGPDVPTPALWGDTVIILNDRGVVTAVDLKSGDMQWQQELPRTAAKFFSSPFVSGDRLVCSRDDGTVFVCGLNRKGLEILGENQMGEPILSTPVPYEDRLFIRGANTLYCIGQS